MFMPVNYRRNLITAYDPFRELRAFNEFFGNSVATTTNAFRTDIRHEDGAYTLEADLPGVAKEDIDIAVKEDVLTIKASRHSAKEDEDKKNGYIRSERSFGSYERSFDISGIDADAITCAYENGVLTITLPEKKVIEPEERKLTIA